MKSKLPNMKGSARMLSFGILAVLLSEVFLVGFGGAVAFPNPRNPSCTNLPGMHLIANPAVSHPASPFCTNNPTFLKPAASGDPQYGWSTTNSAGSYGISDEQTAVQTLLTASPNVGIGAGFYDDLVTEGGANDNIWYHIGIGNDVNDCIVFDGVETCYDSGCSSAPVVWGEYDAPGYAYVELPLVCGSYGSTYTLSIVEDTTSGQYCWAYYVGSTWYDELCLWEESTVNSGGSSNFIEVGGATVPAFGSSDTSWTVYGNGLQYTTSATTSHGISSLTWTNPTTVPKYNSSWDSNYWSTTKSGSAPWSFSYTWDCSGGGCPS